MIDVFISYSRKDLAAVTQLANAITAAGYSVWWDAELPPHKSYGEVITEKIERAKAAIVVWSPTARESEWVRAEADMARSHKKLIQTALGDIMPPLPFNQIQFADLGDWKGEDDHSGWIKVKESLADLCGEREPNPDAPVAASPMPVEPERSVEPSAKQELPRQHIAAPIKPKEKTESGAPKWPIFAGLGVAALGLAGAGAMIASDTNDDYESVSLAEPLSMPDPLPVEPTPEPAPTVSEPLPTLEPVPTAPSYPTSAQTFTGALNRTQSQSFTLGLNEGTSYMIVGNCDVDCTDIDMWLYDEFGNLVAEDVLDDDVPILEVTPAFSAQFSVRIQMFACRIEPCRFEISANPL